MPALLDAGGKRGRTWPAVWVLALMLALSSAGLVQKYFGLPGVVANFLIAAVLVGLVACCGRLWTAVFAKRFRRWLALAAVVLAAGYCVMNPLEDGKGPGKSSDRDEGLEIAVTRMVAGETPYYPENPVAGPLSVLPGAILLAAPFVAVGDVGYQNVLWLVLFMMASAAWLGQKATALPMAAVLMVASPSLLHEFVSGGDLIANGIYVALAIGWCFVTWGKTGPSVGGGGCGHPGAGSATVMSGCAWRWPAAVFLGVAMASRPNFLLLYPLFACGLWRAAGFRVAATASGIAGLVSLCVILPFYLHDPAGFTPWIARKKMAIADHLLPWAGMAMIGMTVILSLAGSWVLLRREPIRPLAMLFRWCAVVTLCPMICAIATRSWVAGTVDFSFMLDRFGVMYLGFAALGWGGGLKADS